MKKISCLHGKIGINLNGYHNFLLNNNLITNKKQSESTFINNYYY